MKGAHFCHFNADLLLDLSHVVASTAPPRVKVGSEALVESLSTEAGSQSPRGGVLFVLCPRPFSFEPEGCWSVRSTVQGQGHRHSPALCWEGLPFFSTVAGSLSIKQQYSNISVPSLFAVTCCDYSDFSYSN